MMAPADALFGFGAWLVGRTEVAGPFSRAHDAAQMAELVGEFCRVNGLEVSADFPETFVIPHETEAGE